MVKDEEQVLGLWCVAQTSCVNQKGFAKQGLDLNQKTWEDHKNKHCSSKNRCKGQKRKRSNIDAKPDIKHETNHEVIDKI